MTQSALVLETSSTMAMLMRSTGRYVHRKITTTAGKDAYKFAMEDCIKYVTSGCEDIDFIRIKLQALRDDAIHRYPKRFLDGCHEERRCHNLAVDQALDIVNCLEARFINGQSDPCPRGYRGRGIVLYEDQSLFG